MTTSSTYNAETLQRQELVKALKALPPDKRKDYLEKLEKQAETFLQEQLKAALAITQRAVTLAAILGAVIAAIIGLAATLATKPEIGVHYAALAPLLIGLVFALLFITGATLPDKFYYAGSDPIYWLTDVAQGKNIDHARAEQIGLYCSSISVNAQSLGGAHRGMKAAFLSAGIGLAFALCVEFTIAISHIAKNGLPSF
jgi:hypothetical protein